jgi:amidase
MRRRKFLKDASLSVLAVSSFSLLSKCAPAAKGDAPIAAQDKFFLEEVTIDQLQKKMAGGELSARKIAEAYIARIKQIDQAGPELRSVVEINPDALDIADSLDAERKAGKVRGPMHGVPVLIKDNIDTGDKMMTTAGSLALDGHRAANDAFIISELRKVGAVILGKTNLSEWANFRSTRSSSGWSSRGGQTKNPYMLDRSPCGSSSGSGTAVAANLCAIAIGTETNGSIACPSSTNGIVGIKPTVGLWSRSGIIPISETQDTAGPMARNVRDATILLGALSAQDKDDKASASRTGQAHNDYTPFLKQDGLAGKVIGVEKAFMKGHEAIDLLLKRSLDVMVSKGATIVEVDIVSKLTELQGPEFEFLKFEFKDGLNRYLKNSNAPVKSLQEVIEFNKKNESKMMPFFKQEILVDSQTKAGVESTDYKDLYVKLIEGTRKVISDVFQTNKLHAVCGPTNGPAWCIDLVNGDFFTGYGMYSPSAVAGYPSITVPMGLVLGLPIGLTFFAKAYEEPELISIAYSYEQASKHRVAPSLTSSLKF